jgi:hypothetical protein
MSAQINGKMREADSRFFAKPAEGKQPFLPHAFARP